MAASRCGKVFSKSPKNQAVQTKKSSRTRQTKIDANKIAKQQKDEVVTDKEKQDMMLEWAMNGFKPSGPKGFAPTEGNGNTCIDRGQQEEPAILISRLSLHMHCMYVASIRLDFHWKWTECTEYNLILRVSTFYPY